MSAGYESLPERLSFRGVDAVLAERIEWINRALLDAVVQEDPMLRDHWREALLNAERARKALIGL